MDVTALLDELISLSRELGREDRQLAILGEGNTSANCGDGTFWVKASGSQLGNITREGFSRVRLDGVIELLQNDSLSDVEVAEGLKKVGYDEKQPKPSVETFLHALCYQEAGANWVGHTHTISVNQILCSKLGAEPFLGHLFPDAIVVCGTKPAVVSYVDPGFYLAVAVRDEFRRYIRENGMPPKVLLMVNHGIIALGKTSKEVLNIHMMADKWARVLAGTYLLGGPNYLPTKDVNRIDNRLDEHYRRGQIGTK